MARFLRRQFGAFGQPVRRISGGGAPRARARRQQAGLVWANLGCEASALHAARIPPHALEPHWASGRSDLVRTTLAMDFGDITALRDLFGPRACKHRPHGVRWSTWRATTPWLTSMSWPLDARRPCGLWRPHGWRRHHDLLRPHRPRRRHGFRWLHRCGYSMANDDPMACGGIMACGDVMA